MASITPQQALDMMYRSMLTGVPTAEFEAAGGYNAVRSLAASTGADMGRPSNEAILKYGPQIASQGYGNASYSPGFDLGTSDQELADAGYKNYYEQAQDNQLSSSPAFKNLQSQYDSLNNNYNSLNTDYGTMSKQLADLQTAYSALNNRYKSATSSTTGGGGVVNDGSISIGDAEPFNAGTSGMVYGPDGKSYSSAAAAIAAGVTNFSYTKPLFASTPSNQPGLTNNADSLNASVTIPAPAIGNVNPSANIANTNVQLFNNGAPQVKLPGTMPNPFLK